MAGRNGITIRDMEEAALGLSGDLGNVIDITEAGDDLGLSMLANQNRTGSSNDRERDRTTTINIPSNNLMSGIEISNLEPLEPISFSMDSSPPLADIQFSREPSLFQNRETATGPSASLQPTQTYRDPAKEKQEKIEYLNKLQRLEQKGFPVARRFTMDNSFEEIKGEFDRLVDARNLESSLRFQRQALMGLVTGMEWMNNKFDPFDLNLDGWSESVHENAEDFDEIFEELYDKYKDRGKMPAEARLMFALAGSGFMCHVSNTFMRQRMPSADDVFKKNPELARQFAQAAASQAGSGFGNLMGMAMGSPQPQMARPAGPQGTDAPTGPFFGTSYGNDMPNSPQVMASVEPVRQTARKEMKGPSGVDDILKTFEEVNRVEMMGYDGGQSQRIDMESVISGDMAESTRTGTGTGTGTGRVNRRRKAAITGQTIALEV